jgi:hypothetical protein
MPPGHQSTKETPSLFNKLFQPVNQFAKAYRAPPPFNQFKFLKLIPRREIAITMKTEFEKKRTHTEAVIPKFPTLATLPGDPEKLYGKF